MSFASALLDELMGRNRNAAFEDGAKQMSWDDPDICRYYLIRFCPHDLFVNTRADLGNCSKIHDDTLKKEFEKASSYRRTLFEDEFLKYAEEILADVERRIKKGKQRLALTPKDKPQSLTPDQQQKIQEKISMLTEKINSLVSKAEKEGTEGAVDTAQGLLKLCDKLREEKEGLKKQVEGSHWLQTAEMTAAQEKQMEVCEVCASFLIVGDAKQRIEDHLMGKQHMGYAKLKGAVQEIHEERQKAKEDREKRLEKEREERRKMLDEQEKRRKQKEDEKRRSRDRDRRSSRSRDRSSRSRDRKRNHRSRSRDRHRSRRSHSRDRDKHKDRYRDRRRDRDSDHDRRDRDRRRHSDRDYDDRRRRDSKKRDRSRSEDKQENRHKEKGEPRKEGDCSSAGEETFPPGEERNGYSSDIVSH